MMQPGDELGASAAELVTAINQQPQRDRAVIGLHSPQVRGAQGDHGDAAGVDRVRFAALASGEHAGPGGQLRGHIHDSFTIGDQALRHVPADTVATLDRPLAVLVPTTGSEHGLVAVAVGAEPAPPDRLLTLVDDLDGRRPLVWIHPDDDPSHQRISLPSFRHGVGGRAALLRAGQSPLEPLHAAVTGRTHAR
jgi:hypothetical protein